MPSTPGDSLANKASRAYAAEAIFGLSLSDLESFSRLCLVKALRRTGLGGGVVPAKQNEHSISREAATHTKRGANFIALDLMPQDGRRVGIFSQGSDISP